MSQNKIKILALKVTISILILGFVAPDIFPIQAYFIPIAQAATGVPKAFSYQGRLTDSTGALLGGAGTNYTFKFSIWDSATPPGGTRLWPASPPGSVTLNVTQGVFNVNIGDTAHGYPDALTFDFNSTDTAYLQVEVLNPATSTYETLSPRQLIASSGYAINAGTATALQTARNINGVPFNGTADITIPSNTDAGALTGTTLAANIVNSSLTLVGHLVSGTLIGTQTFTNNNISDSGGLTIDSGGALNLGTSTSTSVSIGKTGTVTTINGSLTIPNYIDFTNLTAPAYKEGRLFYDPVSKSLSFYNDLSGLSLHIGQTLWTRVKNVTGATIPKGSSVYFSGVDAFGFPTVAKAQANSPVTTQSAGVTTQDIPNGAYGYATGVGLVENLDTSAFTAGDRLFLSPTTPGGFVTTQPAAPFFSMPIGRVIKSDAVSGSIEVVATPFTIGAFTSGSMIFASPLGLTAQDNANLFWDNATKRLGIGDNTPAATLTIGNGTAGSGLFEVFGANGNVTTQGDITLANGGGSITATGGGLTLVGGAASNLSTTAGNITLQPAGAGTTANVQIGAGGAGSATPDLLVVDAKSSAGDPAGTNGAIYYNIANNRFRCFENNAWKDCDSVTAATLQVAYNNSGAITTSGSHDIAFTLTSGNFIASGAGSVNLTPTAASSFTSGGALTLTGGAASALSTTSGDLTLQAGSGTVSLGSSTNLTAATGLTISTGFGNIILHPAGAGTTATVQIGSGGAGSTAPDLFGVDTKSDAGDPAGFNGAMYYNTNSNSFRCYENGAWKNCDTTGGTTTLQSAYSAGATITTGSSTDIVFTLASGNFDVSGAGSVNLTPTGNSSFTSDANLTLTSGTATTWGTTAGDLTLQVNGVGTTGSVHIGAGAPGSNGPDLFGLDVKSTAGDPAGYNGAMYYNGSSNVFRCFENGAWKDCGATGSGGGLSLQQTYINGPTITTTASTDLALILASGDFTASGAGSVNLNPTGASSFTSGGALTLTGGAASVFGTSAGDLTLQAAGNGTTANVHIGAGGVGSATPDLLALDVKSTSGDPTGVNGSMYYNASTNRFRCYENNAWKDCDISGTDTLQTVYNNGATIVTAGSVPITFNLASGNFNVSGAGSVNLTPTGALTLTGGAASTFSTSSGALTIDSAATLNLGTTNATGVSIGKTGTVATVNGSLTIPNYIDFTNTVKPPYSEGRVFYDTTDKTLAYYNDASNSTLNIGQEEWIRVKNITGTDIADGKVVYISGSSGGIPTVALARADSPTTSQAAGITTNAIPNGSISYITNFGLIHKENTASFSAGDQIFLSATSAGDYTATRPSSPNLTVKLGYIAVSDSTLGIVLANIAPAPFQSGILGTGSIPFANSSGLLISNNNNLFWDQVNNRLGIGDNTPAATLTIGNGTPGSALFEVFGSTGNITTKGDINLAAGGTITGTGPLAITATGANALTLDTGTTGTINIGTGISGKTINIGTDNTAADTIVIGSSLDTLKLGKFNTANAIIYTANGTTDGTLASIANGTTGQCLVATTGLAPAWGTCPADASALTGTTLAASVVNSSLTSVGTLTGLTVTAPIIGSITGSSGSTTGNAATATTLETARLINGVSFNGSADITVAADAGTLTGNTLAANVVNSSLTSVGPLTGLTVIAPIAGSVTGSAATVTDAAQPAITSVGTLTGLTVTAPIVGSVTGSSGSTTGNAATATKLETPRLINGVAFDGSADITITAVAAAGTLTGTTLAANVVNSSLTSVGTLAGLTVTAPIVGSVTGSSGSTTGNAATATTLATPRLINGVSFNGSADITVTAAAGTLTGTTLAAGVTASSLTSVGTLAGLTVTAPIVGSITGNAATATTATSATNLAGGLGGQIPYQSAAGTTAFLANGTAGQVLQSNGTTLAPTWVAAATGTLTGLSVVSANGFAGSSSGGTTPAITISTTITGLLKGNGTAISAATAGTDYSLGTSALATGILKSTTTTGALSIAVPADFPVLNQNTTGSAATLTTPRLINGVSFNGSADITVTAAAGTLTGTTLAAGVTASSLTSVGTLAGLTVTAPIVGSITGNAATATTATSATNLAGGLGGQIPYQSAAGTTAFLANGTAGQVLQSNGTTLAPTWVVPSSIAAAGTLTGTTLAANVVNSSLTSVGTLAGLTVTAPIVGSITGSSGSTTGNAATATTLATPRLINGVSFNGSADITVTAAAGTLTGTTLAAGVTASSLTSVGTLAGLTVTAPIVGSITGNAGSATKLATPRLINGVAFDGTADITITAAAAAGTLTGTTLAANVVNSSLTSVGALVSGTQIASQTFTTNNIADSGALTITSGGAGNLALNSASGIVTSNGTTVTLGGSATINGGNAAAGTLTLVSTTNGTKGDIQFFSSANKITSAGALTIAGPIVASNFTGTLTGTNTGDQTITLTGDVTGSGTGTFAATIAPNAVTTGKILDGTILNADLANSTIGLLIGTSGTDVGVTGSPASLGGSLTLNIPNASATNRGVLTAADWAAFNSKQAAFGYTPEDVANKSSNVNLGTSNILYPTQNAVKTYVDNLTTGLIWQNPIENAGVIADTATPVGSPVSGDSYIINTGGNTGVWAGFSAGDLVQYQGTTWVKVKSLVVGDRFGVSFLSPTVPSGAMTGKSDNLVQVSGGTPGAFTYTFIAPVNNYAVFDQNPNSMNYGVSFTYTSSLGEWVALSANTRLSAGNGLQTVGTTVSLGALTADWNQTGVFNINTAGNVNVNGGTLGTTALTGNLFNTTATTLNIGGAATNIVLGAAGATLTGGGALTISSAPTTALTLDSGTTGTVNLATGNNGKTVNIGTGTSGDIINIGTNNTTADTISIGSALDSLSISSAHFTATSAGALTISGALSASNFSGSSSGTNTGDQTSVSGNAGTATALQTPRAINGVNFDGTAPITITAAAGTLTGTVLAANVVNSSLTSVGTLAGLTVTAPIVGSITGNAATATTATSATNLAGGLGGQIPYQSAAGTTAFLANGTAGQVLQSNGTTLAPTWVAAATGTLTGLSVVSANGFAGSSSGGTTPAITISTTITGLLKGNGTAISAATAGTDYSLGTSALATGILKSTTTTGALSIAVPADFPVLNQNTTGSAATLTTPRLINGVSFNGSADITVTAAAGTLTGTTLAAGVTASSLTSVGTLAGLTVTAPIVGSITGNAATATTATSATNLAGGLGGQIPYQSAAGTTAFLANGTAGQVLQSNGTTLAPTWVVPSSIAAAGTLTGTTLAANVVNSSLTSVGTLAGLTVTAPIVGSITGSSGSTTGNAATATTLATPRLINGVSFNGSADITVTAAAGTLTGTTLAAGVTASSLTSVGTLAGLTVTAPIVGSITGNAGSATTATNATNTGITDDTTTNASVYPTWVTANTGNLPQKVSSTKLFFNPSTGLLTSTGFAGPLTGNVTGNVTGSSGSTTGNAATATTLATPRLINGVSFNGSADITVTAAAGTLTGTTLAAGVTASSLTSVGTLAGLTVTAPIVGSITGNAATATTATSATNLAGGLGGQIPYQSAAGTTAFLANGTAGQVLQSNGTTLAPTWVVPSSIAAAGTLTGTTLAANVVNSSLTSVGTLAGLTVTAPIVGSITGSSGSTTGNAATATALQTPRAINGVNFDGTAPITITAAAGTLTGATLAANVLASSLTSVGTLTSLSTSGQITSSLATGTAPFIVASTTNVANLNASSLNGATFAAPGAIGSGTASTGAFTGLTLAGLAGNNAVLYATTGTGVVATAPTSTAGLCLTSGAGAGFVPVWAACGGATPTLQTVYAAASGNTITTTDARNIAFTFADTATDQSLTLTQQGTAPSLIVDDTNAGTNTAIDIRSGGATKLTINELGTISTSGNITVSGTGTITSAGLVTASAGLTVTTGDLAITGGNLSLGGTQRISNAGVGAFITGTTIGSMTFTTNNIADSGALTIKSAGTNPLTLDSGTTGTINIGTGTAGKTINIGTDNTTADTIVIGSPLDTIRLGKFSAVNGVLYVDNANGNVSETAASTGIQCLQTSGVGTAPIWGACGGGGTLQAAYNSGNTILTTAASNVTITDIAGTQLAVNMNGGVAPTVDMVNISNATGVTTAGVSGLQITYLGGAAAVEASGERIDITGGTTAGGIWNGLRLTQGTVTPGITVQDLKLETATLTQSTAATTNINGLNLGVAGALVQQTLAGAINWDGLNITTPALTETTGTVIANGLNITPGSAGVGAELNGINIGNSAGGASTQESAIKVGTGWDNILSSPNASITGAGAMTVTSCTGCGTLIGVQTFVNGNVTYTKTAGTTNAIIELWGGGGAGGSCTAVAGCAAGGGGSGGYARYYFTGMGAGPFTIAVGAGGTAVAGATGNTGGITTFNTGVTTITANGGLGGTTAAGTAVIKYVAGGAGGGISTNGTVNLAGAPGGSGMTSTVVTTESSGFGGSTSLGGGGVAVTNNIGATALAGIAAIANTGSGGSGAATGTTTLATGGAGAGGRIIIYEFR
ncbi:MAG: hypothetical protein WDN47_04210 [Candidatus Doudnabacteria bacterium]